MPAPARRIDASRALIIFSKHFAGPLSDAPRENRTSRSKSVNREWAMKRFIKVFRCREGATAIEYALIASLISIAAIGAMKGLGNSVDTMFNNVSNHLS
jgi:pilus assembly protein Flp/PilA